MNNPTNLWQTFEAKVAGILPGWKTITLAGAAAATNLPDLLQLVMNHVPDIIPLIPEPYKTIVNVALPLLMMWTTNLRSRVESRVETPVTPPAVAQ